MPNTPALDAAAYPHILDTVIAHSPYSTLLLLRRVSQSTKRKADARLAEHVILHMTDFGAPVARGERYLREYDDVFCRDRVRSLTVLSAVPPLGGHPPTVIGDNPLREPDATFSRRFPRPSPPCWQPIPGCMGWCDVAVPQPAFEAYERGIRGGVIGNMMVLDTRRRARKSALERISTALSGARIVDVLGVEAYQLSRGASYGTHDILSAINPEIVRYHSAWGPAVPDFPRCPRRTFFVPLMRWAEDWCVPVGYEPSSHMKEHPTTVVHFTGAEIIPETIRVPGYFPQPWDVSGEIVLIFSDVPEPDGEGDGDGDERGAAVDEVPGQGVEKWLVATSKLMQNNRQSRFIFVDAKPSLFRVQTTLEIPHAIASTLLKDAGISKSSHLQEGSTAVDPEPIVRLLRFMTSDEYREYVGEELYALDMVGLS